MAGLRCCGVMDEAIVEAVRGSAGLGSLPAPATPEAVTEAEKLIGFPLPPLLRRLYLEVANGGFGPAEGILGVRGGASQGDWNDLERYIKTDRIPPVGPLPAWCRCMTGAAPFGPWLTSGTPPVRCGARMRAGSGLRASTWQSG
jgi:hypothetical protein